MPPATALVPEATEYLYTSPIDGSLQTIEVDPGSTDVLSQDAETGDWTISTDTGDHTTTTYDLAGETLTSTDQRGVEHVYTYNSDGEQTQDNVISFGSIATAGQAVNQIDTAFDDMGRVYQVTSQGVVDGLETVLNQVEYAYDGWGNEICEWQALTGSVDTGSTPSVQYVYDDGARGRRGAPIRPPDRRDLSGFPRSQQRPRRSLRLRHGPRRQQWTTSCLAWLRSAKATEPWTPPTRTLARTRIASESYSSRRSTSTIRGRTTFRRPGPLRQRLGSGLGVLRQRLGQSLPRARRLHLHLRPRRQSHQPGQL